MREMEAQIRTLRKQLAEKEQVIDILKKIRGHTLETIEDKYRYVKAESPGACVDGLCRVLGISQSGY